VGEWARILQTTWVEPAYLEPDAAWCEPGGEPVSPLGNGGAFGGKRDSDVAEVACRLAKTHGRPVRVVMTREDTVRCGPKRPPIASGVREDGSGIIRLARPVPTGAEDRIRTAIHAVAPSLEIEFVDVAGPPVSDSFRAVGWAEALILQSSLEQSKDHVVALSGAVAKASIGKEGGGEVVCVSVRCGEILDDVVLRSYCIGAAHMALGWVRSEALAVDTDGMPLDLTIRSFGILRASDTPRIEITIEPDNGPPLNGSDAVFAAVAAAAWQASGYQPRWPIAASSNAF